VRLLRGHRFGGDSPIALLSDAVRDGEVQRAIELLESDATRDVDGSTVRFVRTDDPMSAPTIEVVRAVLRPMLHDLRAAAQEGDAAEALRVASSVRILCAHRHGRFGVSDWNRLCESWLVDRAVGATPVWYAGRPLLVTRNDTRLGLSNGDTGVVVVEGGRTMAVFTSARGVVRFDPAQLDDVDTAYAMTVHKSQGSEYDTVIMVLPPAHSPLVGRELFYTGATRAKRHLFVVGNDSAIRAAVTSPATRMTGLAEALG
jgi:exodeoxyribonuclease V alpha subunit